jgi:hypothetical protein
VTIWQSTTWALTIYDFRALNLLRCLELLVSLRNSLASKIEVEDVFEDGGKNGLKPRTVTSEKRPIGPKGTLLKRG